MTEPALDVYLMERRLYRRALFRSIAKITLAPDQSFSVRTLDISAGGLAIVATANPKTGTEFQIMFSLPINAHKSMTVEAEARVMHSVFSSDEDGFKVGVRFVKIDAKAVNHILKYVESKAV